MDNEYSTGLNLLENLVVDNFMKARLDQNDSDTNGK